MLKSPFFKFIKPIKKQKGLPILHKNKGDFIFIHINKTGGTSIAKAIGLPEKRHFMVKELIAVIGKEKLEKAFVFSVVRNPWDKVVSHYKYRVRTNQTNLEDHPIPFKQWVKLTYGNEKDPFYYDHPKMFAPQSEWLKNDENEIKIDKILRFESIEKEFQDLARIMGIEKKLPHLNASSSKDSYVKYYDQETSEIVRKWFKEDLERFDYKLDLGFQYYS